MIRHTPGTWYINTSGHIPEIRSMINDDFSMGIGYCSTGFSGGMNGTYSIDREEALANAKLCAAAPRLLEILHQIKNYGSHWKESIEQELQELGLEDHIS